MKCLITGGAGFIGGHLARDLIKRGHEVKLVDNFFHPTKEPHDDVEYADVRYYDMIEPFVEWADWVFHLSAQIHVDWSIKHPRHTLDTNVMGTLNVLEAVKKHGKKMVFASTSEVYGTSQSDFMDESHPLDAQSAYGASKVAGDRLCKSYADMYGTRVVILRNFNTFGEWQNDTSYGSVISIFTRKALAGDPLTIYGDGTQERDYMHVKDAVAGYILCMEQGQPGEVINIGSGKTICINDLARCIIDVTGSSSQIEHIDARPGEVQRLCANITKAKEKGFVPKTDFNKDLTRYINWYGESKD